MSLVAPPPHAPHPGYVYVFANPALAGWHKVGHTYRPPHRRAEELSRTAVPQVYETAFARFFWDARAAEQAIHRRIEQEMPGVRRREFFQAPVPFLRSLIEAAPDPGLCRRAPPQEAYDPDEPWASRVADPDWDRSLEGLEEQWHWADEKMRMRDPEERRQGWRMLERLSSSGWAEASWRLAEAIFADQGNAVGAERAAWVAEAAEVQGLAGGALRAAWLRSWGSPEAFAAWRRALDGAWVQWGNRRGGPGRHLQETLDVERAIWGQHPDRALAQHPWWTPVGVLPSGVPGP